MINRRCCNEKFFTKNPRNIAFSIVVILLALVPLFTDMGLLTSSSIVRFGRYITFAIVAIGIDLIWGYTGILSLGHGIYFVLVLMVWLCIYCFKKLVEK